MVAIVLYKNYSRKIFYDDHVFFNQDIIIILAIRAVVCSFEPPHILCRNGPRK